MAEKIVYETTCSMFPGRKIKIEGRVPQCSDRFHVNLKDRNGASIHLHIGVRFSEGCIVRNTFTQADWGLEERSGGMPIVKGQSFTIELECKLRAILISINGCHFSDYKHRLPYDTIDYVTVDSDVEVCDVSFSGIPQQRC